jgi:hypothetical protein
MCQASFSRRVNSDPLCAGLFEFISIAGIAVVQGIHNELRLEVFSESSDDLSCDIVLDRIIYGFNGTTSFEGFLLYYVPHVHMLWILL